MKSYHYALIAIALIAAYFIFRKKEDSELSYIPPKSNPSKDSLLDGIKDAATGKDKGSNIVSINDGPKPTNPTFGTMQRPPTQSMSFVSRQTVSMDGKSPQTIPSPSTDYVRWQYGTVDGNCAKRKKYYGSEASSYPGGVHYGPWQPC